YSNIEVKSLRPNKITVENDKATIELIAELSMTGAQSAASVRLLQARRTIQMVRETAVWKIWKYITPEDELAVALSAVKTPEEARALLDKQSELVTPDLVRALVRQARDLLARGKQAEALMIDDLALNIAQRLNDKTGMFVSLRVKGELFRVRGDYKQALEYLDQCLRLAQELGDKANIANALNSMGIVYALQSDNPAALTMFQRSLQIK